MKPLTILSTFLVAAISYLPPAEKPISEEEVSSLITNIKNNSTREAISPGDTLYICTGTHPTLKEVIFSYGSGKGRLETRLKPSSSTPAESHGKDGGIIYHLVISEGDGFPIEGTPEAVAVSAIISVPIPKSGKNFYAVIPMRAPFPGYPENPDVRKRVLDMYHDAIRNTGQFKPYWPEIK